MSDPLSPIILDAASNNVPIGGCAYFGTDAVQFTLQGKSWLKSGFVVSASALPDIPPISDSSAVFRYDEYTTEVSQQYMQMLIKSSFGYTALSHGGNSSFKARLYSPVSDSWVLGDTSINNYYISSVVAVGATLFAVAPSTYQYDYWSYVLKSVDGGLNWTEIMTTGSRQNASDERFAGLALGKNGTLLLHGNNTQPNNVYDTRTPIFVKRSTDNGVTWTKYTGGAIDYFIALDSAEDGVWVAATSNYARSIGSYSTYVLKRSVDDGITWTTLTIPDIVAQRAFIDILYVGNGEWVGLVAESSGGYRNLIRSIDNGATWAITLRAVSSAANNLGFSKFQLGSDGTVYAIFSTGQIGVLSSDRASVSSLLSSARPYSQTIIPSNLNGDRDVFIDGDTVVYMTPKDTPGFVKRAIPGKMVGIFKSKDNLYMRIA